MNTTNLHVGSPVRPYRYQVYCQQRAGNYTIRMQADSALEAMQAFLDTAPAFDGGAVRLWDRHNQRLLAAAEWKVEMTRMSFAVRARNNVFHDDQTARLARDIAQREALVQAIATDLRIST